MFRTSRTKTSDYHLTMTQPNTRTPWQSTLKYLEAVVQLFWQN